MTAERTEALSLLIDLAAEFPQLRLCQLIVNVCGVDPFYVEDARFVEQMKAFRVKHSPHRELS
jgi:hypothetical protein